MKFKHTKKGWRQMRTTKKDLEKKINELRLTIETQAENMQSYRDQATEAEKQTAKARVDVARVQADADFEILRLSTKVAALEFAVALAHQANTKQAYALRKAGLVQPTDTLAMAVSPDEMENVSYQRRGERLDLVTKKPVDFITKT